LELCELLEGSGAATGLWAHGKTASGGSWIIRSGATAIAWSPDGNRIVAGFDYGAVYLLRPDNLAVGPTIVTAWQHVSDGIRNVANSAHFGCPICLTWSEVPQGLLGKSLDCPRCDAALLLNASMIEADWRPIAEAWRRRD
jgi:hypothetical protein